MSERLSQTQPTGNGRARGLVSSRVSGARVEAHTFAPPDDLADVVLCLWIGRWDLPADASHHTRLLADPCVNLCFEVSEPQLGPAERLVGVWSTLWERTLAGRGFVRAAKLRPGAAGAFLDDASVWRDRVVHLDEVWPEWSRTDACVDPDDGVALAALVALLRARRRPSPDTDLAVRVCALVASDVGVSSVEALSDRTGLSVRDLQRLFRQHVGLSPKQVIRRHRLQEAAMRIEAGDYVNLAELATSLGYADHAHLTRDFKDVVGVPASAFARDVHR